MTKAQLAASRTLWRAREVYHYRKWRLLVRTKPVGDPGRTDQHTQYEVALANRKARDHQIRLVSNADIISHCDQAGLDFIANHEGILPYVYPDSRGFATFGVGHLLHRSAPTAADYAKWGSETHPKYTKAEAVVFFKRDIMPYEAAVRKLFAHARLKATQYRFNASCSMTFNIGIGGMLASTFFRKVQEGNAAGAAQAMLLWDQPPEIRGRRRDEATLFKRR